VIFWRWRARRGPLARGLAAALLGAWIFGSAVESNAAARYALDIGLDVSGDRRGRSPLLEWVRAEGPGYELYTNNSIALYFRAGRASRELPLVFDSATVRALGRRLAERGGAVVMFRTPKTLVPRPFMTERKMRPYVEALGLREAARYEDGVVWVAGGE
jgi:hypothetical protein